MRANKNTPVNFQPSDIAEEVDPDQPIRLIEVCQWPDKALLPFAALFLATSLLLPISAQAAGEVFSKVHDCAQDSGGVSNCIANEINIASASTAIANADVCLEGEKVFLERIDVAYGLNTGQRFDPLLWVGTQGNDPRDTGGSCYVSSVPSDAGDPISIFKDLEGDPGDSCLDILNPGLDEKPVSYKFGDEFEVECHNFEDKPGELEPIADVKAIVTWLQNTSLACGNGPGESFSPGAPSKCDASIISLGIPYVPVEEQATLTLRKNVTNDNGGNGVDTNWTLSANGPVKRSGAEGDAAITEEVLPIGAYVLGESGGPADYAASGWSCSGGSLSGDTLTLSGGDVAVCTITNDDIAPQLTIIEHIINDNVGNAVASDWTVDVTATDPSDNLFPGSEAPGVTISIDAGAYSVNDSGPAGYSQSFSAGCEGVLALGESATCTITHDDVIIPSQPVLTLLKHVINNNGGDQVDTDWSLIADGPVLRAGVEGSAAVTSAEVLPGVYTLSESGPDGYEASAWSCVGGSLSGDQLTLVVSDVATCTITNDDIPPTLTLTKQVINDEGGGAAANDFNISVGGNVVLSGQTNEYAANTPLAINETLLADYIFVSITGDARCPVALGDIVSLDEGEDLNCTITNDDNFISATLTLQKDVTNDNGGNQADTDWSLIADGPVLRAGAEGSAAVTSAEVLPGVYTLSESGPDGYESSDWSCVGGSLSGDQLTLVDNDIATCTITNDDIPPTLTLTKQVINDEGGGAAANDFNISVGGNVVLSGQTNDYAANTPLAINETLLTDYVFVNITGDARCPVALGGSVSLDEGENLNCTITNDDNFSSATLTLQKDVTNDNGGNQVDTDWSLIADGPVLRAGVEGSDAVTDAEVLPGVYTLDESGPDGYVASGWNCVGGSLNGDQLTLVDNDVATCTITNNDIAPTLTLTKLVINDEGGLAVANDFNISVGGNVVLSGVTNSYAANTPLAIDETLLADYIFVSITGDPRCPDGLGGMVSLNEGENLSCTITNNDVIGLPADVRLTLLKDVINNNGGDQLDTDWILTASGPVVRSGIEGSDAVTDADVLPGVYTLSEGGPNGYEASDWSCIGGSLSGTQLTLLAGDVATCTITNNDIAPTLTLTKLVINNEGGLAVADDFKISVSGNVVLSGVANQYAANTPLVINETLLADYIFVSITGDAKCPDALGGVVSLDEGENLICTITNNDLIDQPADVRLTLLKDVVNDNDGNQLDTAWILRASGPVVRSGIEGSQAVTNSIVLPGIYALSESGPGGYIASNWSCIGGSLSGNQLTLAAGDEASCTITNNDTAPDGPAACLTLTLTLEHRMSVLKKQWHFKSPVALQSMAEKWNIPSPWKTWAVILPMVSS